MASRLGSAPSRRFVESLRIALDDFSCQVSSAEDARFWIRIELPVEETLRISDLNPGDVARADVAAALAEILGQLPDAERLVVLDVLPEWQSHPSMQVELERRVSALRDILTRALKGPVSESIPFDLREDRGKLNLHLDLAKAT